MDEARISLVVPLHNGQPYRDQLLRIITQQAPHLFEVTIIDDLAGEDCFESQSLVDDLAILDIPISYIQHNGGDPNRSYNLGIQNSSGSHVWILDQDDLPSENFSKVSKLLLENSESELEILAASVKVQNRALNWMVSLNGVVIQTLLWKYRKQDKHVVPQWIPVLGVISTRSGLIYPRSALAQVMFPEPYYPESDGDHLLLIRKMCTMHYTSKVSIEYTIHSGSVSSSRNRSQVHPVKPDGLDRLTYHAHALDRRFRTGVMQLVRRFQK